MNTPRLVASDVDGTLLDGEERVTARTRAAVHAARDAGAVFVLVTGRPPRWVPPVVEQLGIAPMAVCANGAVVYDAAADEVRHAETVATDVLAEVVAIALRVLPGAGLAAERVGRSAHDSATPQFVAAPGYAHAWLNPDHVEVAADELVASPAVKLLVRLPGTTSSEMARLLRPALAGVVDVTFSTENGLIEVAAPGVSKATGLARVAAAAGIDAADVIAFGDMPNDVPMLAWAGHGVAMGNAHDEVRAVADEIAAPNTEDGLAAVLERLFPDRRRSG